MGYIENKMSERAVEAYESGEMPLTKWTKSQILEELAQISDLDFSKFTLKTLRETFLFNSSWHHTGKYFNKTDFYSIDIDKVENFTKEKIDDFLELDKAERLERKQEQKKEKLIDTGYFAKCKVTEFTKVRGRYYPKEEIDFYFIYNNKAYASVYHYKKIDGKHFEILNKFNKLEDLPENEKNNMESLHRRLIENGIVKHLKINKNKEENKKKNTLDINSLNPKNSKDNINNYLKERSTTNITKEKKFSKDKSIKL